MSEERDKLKNLLLREEVAQIKAIQKLLNDQKQFSQKVSEVLDSATDQVIKNNPKFQKKFSHIDSKAYVRAIKANKQTFIDALLPIIGPMIRQSVTSAIRRFVADVNRTLELGFSLKALKWRWQAFRTGVPFAELVFNNTIAYQVQQVFLIDNETGLLIEYAGQEDALLQDKEAMSAMLTAIQDFVKDSLNSQSEGLSAAEFNDDLLWLIKGEQANLAVVVKGAPTNRLREHLTVANEQIHLDFSADLEDQSRWNNHPELKLQLEQLLLTKSQSEQDDQQGINWWPWALVIFGLLFWYIWHSYLQHQNHTLLKNQLTATPGFVLQDLSHSGNQLTAFGLADPLADFSHISADVTLKTTPFISLDDQLVRKRVQTFINQPSVNVEVEQGQVTLTGTDPQKPEFSHQLNDLKLLPGVSSVNNQLTVAEVPLSLAERLTEFLKLNPPPEQVLVTSTADTIWVSGQQLASTAGAYVKQLQQVFTSVDDSNLRRYQPNQIKSLISQTHITLVQTNQLSAQQRQQLHQVHQHFLLLVPEADHLKLKLVAQSDCQGSLLESNENIDKRANLVKNELIAMGMNSEQITTEPDYCDDIVSTVDTGRLGVNFGVIE